MAKTSRDRPPLYTLPNAISAFRLLGVPFLLWSGYQDQRTLFFVIVATLLLSDWLDGRLASVLDQRTALGARLDSGVDALMYAAIALSFWWLEGEVIRDHLVLLLCVLGSWLVSTVAALLRFRKTPSYHTWSAKIAWFVAACTVFLLLLTEHTFLLAWALGLAIFANVHALAITFSLPIWEADVWSLRQAWRLRRSQRRGEPPSNPPPAS